MAVVVKKEEKQKSVLLKMKNKSDEEEFKNLFKEMYPNDWKKIIFTYNIEKNNTPKGKKHPMPFPDKYLSNMYKVARKKYKEL